MTEKCEKCQERPVEYDAPARLCFLCWTEWWVDGLGIKNAKERARELREMRTRLKKTNKAEDR